jgi:HEAT repeat protein
MGLDSEGAKAREEAVRALVGDEAALDDLSRILRQDVNDNVRKAAAEVLGTLGSVAGPALQACLEDETEKTFIRKAAATSIGVAGLKEAAASLEQALKGAEDFKFQMALVDALGAVGAVSELAAAVPRLKRGNAAGLAVTWLGKLGGPEAERAVITAAAFDDPGVRKAAITAIGKLKPADGPVTVAGLASHDEVGVRLRAVEQLAAFEDGVVVAPLVDRLLFDPEEGVRKAAATTLASRPVSPDVLAAVVAALQQSNVVRKDVRPSLVAAALAPAVKSSYPDGTTVFDALIEAALAANDRVNELLADLLSACCDENADMAGDLVNAYETTHPDDAKALTRLRVALGGQRALDPILRQLQDDLRQFFQIPIDQLNTETREAWERASERALRAFGVRVAMSVGVFVTGLLLVVGSAAKFLFGSIDGAAAWGTGGTFVGGLTTMLAVTYSGPLKDIRDSVRDLGSATAAFIGFVHQVLQISHTFSSLYLRDRITFDDAAKASELLQKATAAAVVSLAPTQPATAAARSGDDLLARLAHGDIRSRTQRTSES